MSGVRPPALPPDLAYAAFYCEENVWHLAGDDRLGRPAHAVLVTNATRTCALWRQRAGHPVVWDYHALLVAGPPGAALACDPDTTLGFPLPLAAWIDGTFPFGDAVTPALRPRFRVVEAGEFRRFFASDRSHMRGSPHPPPPWPPIRTETETMNLPRLLDLDVPVPGSVVDLAGLRRLFAAAP